MRKRNLLFTLLLCLLPYAGNARTLNEIGAELSTLAVELKEAQKKLPYLEETVDSGQINIERKEGDLQDIADPKERLKTQNAITATIEYLKPWKKQLEDTRTAISSLRAKIAALGTEYQVELARSNQIGSSEQERQRIAATYTKLEELAKTTQPPLTHDTTPLEYGMLVQLRCRGVSSNDYTQWRTAFTHAGASKDEWHNEPYNSPYEMLFKTKETEFPESRYKVLAPEIKQLLGPDDWRAENGGQFLMIRRAGYPTSTGFIRVGETIEIYSLLSERTPSQIKKFPPVKDLAERQEFGLGRKWWVTSESTASNGYPRILVGPNSDPHRPDKKSLPRPMQGNGLFVIEVKGKKAGEYVLASDIVQIKTAPENPVNPGTYLWKDDTHARWGEWGQILVGGPNGKDTLGIDVLGIDRSLTPRNQFLIQPVPAATDRNNPARSRGQLSLIEKQTNARSMTPAFLPHGTIIALQPHAQSSREQNTYFIAHGEQLALASTDTINPAAQFEVLYDQDGWIGLRNRKTQKFLQGSIPPQVKTEFFKDRIHTFWHWTLWGNTFAAYLRNQATHLFLGAAENQALATKRLDKKNRLHLKIVSRPISHAFADIRIDNALYGKQNITDALQKHIDDRGGKDAYIAPLDFPKTLGIKRAYVPTWISITYTTGQMQKKALFNYWQPINLVSQVRGSTQRRIKKPEHPRLADEPKILTDEQLLSTEEFKRMIADYRQRLRQRSRPPLEKLVSQRVPGAETELLSLLNAAKYDPLFAHSMHQIDILINRVKRPSLRQVIARKDLTLEQRVAALRKLIAPPIEVKTLQDKIKFITVVEILIHQRIPPINQALHNLVGAMLWNLPLGKKHEANYKQWLSAMRNVLGKPVGAKPLYPPAYTTWLPGLSFKQRLALANREIDPAWKMIAYHGLVNRKDADPELFLSALTSIIEQRIPQTKAPLEEILGMMQWSPSFTSADGRPSDLYIEKIKKLREKLTEAWKPTDTRTSETIVEHPVKEISQEQPKPSISIEPAPHELDHFESTIEEIVEDEIEDITKLLSQPIEP